MHERHEFTPPAPNRIWVGDLTATPTRGGWLYLAVVLDLYLGRIIGWAMSLRLEQQVALMARCRRPSPIDAHDRGWPIYSDQGATYTSGTYQRLMNRRDLIVSMSWKGNSYDNVVVESVFWTLKNELVHDQPFWSREEAQAAVFECIAVFLNRQRIHQALGYISLVQYGAADMS